MFLMHLPVFFDGFNMVTMEIFGPDDEMVMAGYYQGTKRPQGMLLKPMQRMCGL
jgi:hypothetical protein